MADSTLSDDFLAVPAADEISGSAYGEPQPPAPRRRATTALTTAVWLVVGVVVGVIAVAALHSGRSASANGLPVSAGNQLPGQQQGRFPGPQPGGFGGGFTGGFGGRDGEQHVVGTLEAVSSSTITVQSATGTTTYTVDSRTELVKDGQPVSSLWPERLEP